MTTSTTALDGWQRGRAPTRAFAPRWAPYASGLLTALMLVSGVQADPRRAAAQLTRAVTGADKAAIITWAKQNLHDPYSLRAAAISDAIPVEQGGTVVCVAYD